jgi:hypothetical protein
MSESNAAEYANHIPEAVRRQSRRADEIAAQFTQPVEEPVEEPVVEPAPAAQEPAPAAAPAPAPVVEDDWKQKYLTLQGKYNSEVPGLRAELDGVRRVLASMNERPAPAAQPEPKTTTVVIPEKDVEEFGPDLIARARAWARAELAPELDEIRDIKSKLTGMQQNHQQVVAMTSQQVVMAAMDNDPSCNGRDGSRYNWRQVNDDPTFVTWLQQPDPFSGHVRLAMLRDAFNAGQSSRMKAFFDTFVREQTVSQSPPAAQATDTPAREPGRPSLEDFAMPGRINGSAPVGASNEKRVWSQRDITAFYRSIQQGKFEGKAAERLRQEQDIIAAASEGRIR